MFARLLAALLYFVPFAALGEGRPAFGPPGYELPERVTPGVLDEIYQAILRDNCRTRECEYLRIAIVQVLDNPNRRKNPGTIWKDRAPDIPYGVVKSREIDALLGGVRPMWPQICRAVVEIGARDDFVHGYETYSWLAAASLDVARHLSSPGLDCLGQALSAMPESKYFQASKRGAWIYCLDERRGAARCARLKPTDPEFLPAPPFPSIQ